jgi:hypothetical protein
MTVRSVLGCTRAALNNDDDSDLHPLEYADVVEVAREMIQETTVRWTLPTSSGSTRGSGRLSEGREGDAAILHRAAASLQHLLSSLD